MDKTLEINTQYKQNFKLQAMPTLQEPPVSLIRHGF